MAKRDRDILKKFFIDKKENEVIKKKMRKANKENFSDFAREILMTGEVKVIDFEILKQVRYEINRVGNNINQIIKLAHENGKIEKNEINEVIKLQDELLDTISKIRKENIQEFKK